jgi:transposase
MYRLKTGCQWRELPMKQFFRTKYSWNSVYHHFQKWCKDGSWERAWSALLQKYRSALDMSSVQLDGTHTPAKRGGEAVGYQGRRKCRTSNMLILTDAQGVPLACGDAVAGNHHDGYELVGQVEQMWSSIESARIPTDGLFLNADAGFDTAEFRQHCEQREVTGNVDHNKRNGAEEEHLFDEHREQQNLKPSQTCPCCLKSKR